MSNPASTGEVADLFGITEPRLNDLVRRGKIQPKPPTVAGRRLWQREHVLQAADHLGLLTDDLRSQITAAADGGSQ